MVAQTCNPTKCTRSGNITISIVSHAQSDMVDALLRQLAELRDPSITRVVVVHNLPDIDLPKPYHAEFELIQLHNQEPQGFSANHNLAFIHCATPGFAVLNPDLDLRCGNPFPALLQAAFADPRLGAVAPTLVQPDTLKAEPNRGVVTPLELIRRRLPGWKPPDEPAWLVGAFLLLRTEAFRDIGGFDERFHLYCEDVDLGLRLRAFGWRIKRVENAKVVHLTQRNSHRHLKHIRWHLFSLFKLWMKIGAQGPRRASASESPRRGRNEESKHP